MSGMRFGNNNFVNTDNFLASSTFNSSYPIANIYDTRRGVYGSFRGNFIVTTGENNLYINDGTDKTITLTSAEYTGTTLAAHIQTQLNASSSNWTCTYSATTYKFTIDRSSGTKIIRLSVLTDAVWDMIGFTAATDTAAPYTSDAARIHHYEYLTIDLGINQEIGFVGLIGPINEKLGLSGTADVRIQGNNLNTWAAPATDVPLTIGGTGAFAFPDTSHRYWRLLVKDRGNPGGPAALKISYLSISTAVKFAVTSIANGFSVQYLDNSTVLVSENGTKYFDTRPKIWTLGGEIQIVYSDERRDLEQFFYDSGISQPFFVSIDPGLLVFEGHSEATKFVRFTDTPSLTHVIRDYFTASIAMEEVV
jgi:hypothetical protein